MSSRFNNTLLPAGAIAVIYALLLLEFAAISPDPRLRAFLVNDFPTAKQGVVVRARLELDYKKGQPPPDVGDIIVKVNDVPTPTLIDYFRAIGSLYFPHKIDRADPDDRPQEWRPGNIGPIVREIDATTDTSRILVEVLYRKPETKHEIRRCWVEVQAPPTGSLVISILWLVPHLAILFVGGAACWQRPFDRAARIFFLMCIVTMVAYIGGFHWWTISVSTWLLVPFVFCGVFLPAVTLHFFLIFPRPASWSIRHPRWFLTALYAAPLAAAVAITACLITADLSPAVAGAPDPQIVEDKQHILATLQLVINAFLVMASLYYAVTMTVLVRTMLIVRDPVERAQVRWILGAAILAAIPVGYTMYLAVSDRTTFAFGGAQSKYPMFFASFLFLFAYAAGMVRHRLLLADEVIGKGLRYYCARAALTGTVALALAGMALWLGIWEGSLPRPQSTFVVIAVIVLAVFLLLIARDRAQQALDRRFFSEKYQLGAALRGMRVGAGFLTNDGDLGRRVIDSCHEALEVNRIAIYRRDDPRGNRFELTAARGEFPEELRLDAEVVEFVEAGGSAQRVLAGNRSDLSLRQSLLRTLAAQLLYAPPAGENASTLLILGPKADEASYTAEDLTFLSALGHVADVAFAGLGTHQRLTSQLQLSEGTITSQNRQIAVLQKELGEFHQSSKPEQRRRALTSDFHRDLIHGESQAITEVLETVRKVAGSDATVMIRGESGTGKELLAQIIHDNSNRPEGPLVRVHCAALSPTLLESELFGHVKGAFTGADKDKIGRFELAHGGTLFLDEIGEISLETQVKLLRVMQERSFEPVGSSRSVEVDVRIITATNRNLEEMIADGRFREDLYYRLNVISVTVPPLRERKGDVVELAFTFLHRAAQRSHKTLSGIADDALAALSRYDWPGNVRELQNVLERAVVLAEGETILLTDLPAELRGDQAPSRQPDTSASPRPPRRRRVRRPPESRAPVEPSPEISNTDDAERQMLIDALAQTDGNKARAARLLGLPRSTFFSKLKKHELT